MKGRLNLSTTAENEDCAAGILKASASVCVPNAGKRNQITLSSSTGREALWNDFISGLKLGLSVEKKKVLARSRQGNRERVFLGRGMGSDISDPSISGKGGNQRSAGNVQVCSACPTRFFNRRQTMGL
jgi:hypothetical protein